MFHFLGKSVWLSCLVIFSQVDLKSVVWKTASFHSPVLLDFSIALKAIMMNVFYLLTQLVAAIFGLIPHSKMSPMDRACTSVHWMVQTDQ